MPDPEISLFSAFILGLVEGLTEFLPISSTGHMILVSPPLGLDLKSQGVQAFEIVIQAGAVLAVLGLYAPKVKLMLQGVMGRSASGLRLLGLLLTSFVPAAVLGVLLKDHIEEHLFGIRPVILALAVGGVAMIVLDHRKIRSRFVASEGSRDDYAVSMTFAAALMIGFAQSLALWPGTSRSMVTILAAMMVGLSPKAAAEYSFLLALPTLGAACAYDLLKEGDHVVASAGMSGLLVGLVVSFVVAWLTMRYFIKYLERRGLAIFGWYRIAMAAVIALAMPL